MCVVPLNDLVRIKGLSAKRLVLLCDQKESPILGLVSRHQPIKNRSPYQSWNTFLSRHQPIKNSSPSIEPPAHSATSRCSGPGLCSVSSPYMKSIAWLISKSTSFVGAIIFLSQIVSSDMTYIQILHLMYLLRFLLLIFLSPRELVSWASLDDPICAHFLVESHDFYKSVFDRRSVGLPLKSCWSFLL